MIGFNWNETLYLHKQPQLKIITSIAKSLYTNFLYTICSLTLLIKKKTEGVARKSNDTVQLRKNNTTVDFNLFDKIYKNKIIKSCLIDDWSGQVGCHIDEPPELIIFDLFETAWHRSWHISCINRDITYKLLALFHLYGSKWAKHKKLLALLVL